MADITLAAVPLVAKVFSLCLDLYKVFTETKHMGDASQTLLWKFRIQQVRLQIWGEEWGLLISPSHRSPGDQDHDVDHLVLETLIRISNTLNDYKELKSRYSLSLVSEAANPPVLPRRDTIEDLINAELPQFDRRDTELRASRSRSTSLFTKLRWAVGDKSKLEAIIKDLKDYNDGLYHFLSATERRRLRQGLAPELIRQSQLEELADLQHAAQGYDLLPDICALRRRYFDTISPPVNPPLASIGLVATRNDSSGVLLSLANLSLSKANSNTIVSRQRAVYRTKPSEAPVEVIVEWKNYGQDSNDRLQEESVARLASLLQFSTIAKPLCIPRCLGYVSEHLNFRTGLVFCHETSVSSPGKDLTCLDDLLKLKGVPPLGDRFKLALDLASSLSILHTAGWLHKYLSTENVLFLDTLPTNSSVCRLGKPSLVGFGYSRPNEAGTVSELVSTVGVDYHRHPAAQGLQRKTYCPAFDIYALGVILLEIGYWRRIQDFWKPEYSPATFRQDLIKFHTPRLAPKTGLIYSNLVTACLGGEMSEPGLDNIELQSRFYWLVVNELSRLVV